MLRETLATVSFLHVEGFSMLGMRKINGRFRITGKWGLYIIFSLFLPRDDCPAELAANSAEEALSDADPLPARGACLDRKPLLSSPLPFTQDSTFRGGRRGSGGIDYSESRNTWNDHQRVYRRVVVHYICILLQLGAAVSVDHPLKCQQGGHPCLVLVTHHYKRGGSALG